jgi:hypothetical protein
MNVLPQDRSPLLDSQYLSYLISYLKWVGWQIAEETPTWYEFQGGQDASGTPLPLILPRDPNTSDAKGYIEKAIELLSAISDESIHLTAQRVRSVYNDIFIISNLETGAYQSISLGLAATQIAKIKSLVLYGVRSERSPQPYFHKQSGVGTNMLKLFRFGHTLQGSFGLTIESPLVHESDRFIRESPNQPPLLANLDDYIEEESITLAPLERRIMERLVRGLLITQRATRNHSIEPIVEEYGSGFSGNMCEAIVKIAEDNQPIEYRVLWSPKISASEDIASIDSIRLNETSYTLLKEATQEMKKREPEFESVRGIVTHIGSTGAPLGEQDEGRTIIVRRVFDDNRRPHSIMIPLDRNQYLEAHKAHLDWSTIEITGVVERVGNNYRLLDGRDFRVLNSPSS